MEQIKAILFALGLSGEKSSSLTLAVLHTLPIQTMRLFLSHITEEAPVANVLKDWIESTFSGHLEVFASTNPSDNPIGTKWIQTVRGALKSCDLLIIIGSPASISRPWIHFEAGAAWIRDIDIITLCHSGLAVGSLPPPLSEFQSVSISDPLVAERIFKRLADKLGLTKLPRISFEQFHLELTEATEIGCLNTITQASRIEQFFKTDFVQHMMRHGLPLEAVVGAFRSSSTIAELADHLQAALPNPTTCSYFDAKSLHTDYFGMVNLSRDRLGLAYFENGPKS